MFDLTNPDNFISELGITRYEYVAKFYNEKCVDDFSEKLTTFFDVKKQGNTYELFQDGSELIQNNPRFQKYEGKLDLAFTSPPYFNREQYSQDENQSFIAYGEYDDWRENFLRPTLTTIYNYLKPWSRSLPINMAFTQRSCQNQSPASMVPGCIQTYH